MNPSASPVPLPLRLDPEPGESLNGFLLRLTERNGRKHPREILGIQAAQVSFPGYGTDPEFAKTLSIIAGRPVGSLLPLCAERTGSSEVAGAPLLRYQGQLLRPFDLHHRQRSVCPACLAEQVVHRARWDLLGLGDCSRHGTQLIWRCPACDEAIGWDRCGMSACRCGADMRRAEVPASREDRLALATYLEGRMEGEAVVGPTLLDGLELYQAIRVMLLLGALRLGARPWGVAYHARAQDRHDLLSTGFKLAGTRAGGIVHLLDGLPALFGREPTGILHMIEGYGWMAASRNEDVRQTGLVLLDISREAERGLPVPLKPLRKAWLS